MILHMVLISMLALTREAVFIDNSESKNSLQSRKKTASITSELETIQKLAALHRSKNIFCTSNGRFCVPASYSK